MGKSAGKETWQYAIMRMQGFGFVGQGGLITQPGMINCDIKPDRQNVSGNLENICTLIEIFNKQ
jgi:hypothetical protein